MFKSVVVIFKDRKKILLLMNYWIFWYGLRIDLVEILEYNNYSILRYDGNRDDIFVLWGDRNMFDLIVDFFWI